MGSNINFSESSIVVSKNNDAKLDFTISSDGGTSVVDNKSLTSENSLYKSRINITDWESIKRIQIELTNLY